MARSEIKRMPIAEFRALGLVHEINRLLLHPLGLALEVVVDESGTERLGGVWDYREDPEGMHYGPDLLSAEKAETVAAMMFSRRQQRREQTGYVIQPLDTEAPTLTTTYINPAERTR